MERLAQFRMAESRRFTANRGRGSNCRMVERTAKRVSTDHASRTDDDQPLLNFGRDHDRARSSTQSNVCETVTSTCGVWTRKLDQARRCEARPRIPGHLAKPPPLLPVSKCVGYLLRRPRHKVPPHQNLLWKR